MEGQKRKVGRPATQPRIGEKATLGVRVPPALKRRLNQAAKANDRSLSQEAELRLEQSFHNEEYLEQATDRIYGRELSAVLMLINEEIRRVGLYMGFVSTQSVEGSQRWLPNPVAYHQVVQATNEILEAFRPEGDPDPECLNLPLPPGVSEKDYKDQLRRFGRSDARILLASLASPETAPFTARPTISFARERLGIDVCARAAERFAGELDQ